MRIRSLVVYALLRIAFFVVPLGIMMLFPVFWELWWLATLFAAIIGFSLSVIFLRKPLGEVSEGLYERQQAKKRKKADELDAEAEDAADDAQRG